MANNTNTNNTNTNTNKEGDTEMSKLKALALGGLKITGKVITKGLGDTPSKKVATAGAIGSGIWGLVTGDYVTGGAGAAAGVGLRYKKQVGQVIDYLDKLVGTNKEDNKESLSLKDKAVKLRDNVKDKVMAKFNTKEDKKEPKKEDKLNNAALAMYFDDPAVISKIADLKEKALNEPLSETEEALVKLACGVGL